MKLLAILLVSAISFSLGSVFDSFGSPASGKIENVDFPISYNNIIVYEIRLNRINDQIADILIKKQLDTRTVVVFTTGKSYKTDNRWLYVDNPREIRIPLHRDVASAVTPIEFISVVYHELGHVVLGHSHLVNKRNTSAERAADVWAIANGSELGVDAKTLKSGFNKLAFSDQEKDFRTEIMNAMAEAGL